MSAAPFTQLGLNSSILRALEEEGYSVPTPIQARAIPIVLQERDLMATAQTGTGKTAAFALPILHLMQQREDGPRGLRALILTPTRELALQIDESLRTYGRHLPFRTVTVLGGVSDRPQIQALRRRPDIMVATPGRLLDLMGQGHVRFEHLRFLVLDEGDRMLDMGFIRDVRRIIQELPAARQSLLFSATLPRDIADLAATMLRDPAQVSVAPDAAVADNIAQKVLYVEQQDKKDLLAAVLRGDDVRRVLVFTRTKHRANRVAQQLSRLGIAADAIHSNKSQGARQRALAAFDGGRTRVLVATDIVARGIDVEDISHVINFELPNEPESYVHRIGRTARAGAAGIALSFCNAEEVAYLESIEKLIRIRLTPVDDHPFHSPSIAALRGRRRGVPSNGNGARRSGSRGGGRETRSNGGGNGSSAAAVRRGADGDRSRGARNHGQGTGAGGGGDTRAPWRAASARSGGRPRQTGEGSQDAPRDAPVSAVMVASGTPSAGVSSPGAYGRPPRVRAGRGR